jgi:glucose/arabinose dehydrogenase
VPIAWLRGRFENSHAASTVGLIATFGNHIDPRVQPQRPPLGLAFNTGAGLPAHYQDGAFIGEHGSWDRIQFNGYKVVFVPFSNGRPSGKAQDVVTGFIDADGHARGRPVAVAFDKAGALLIADDVGNTVWRVSSE